MQSDSQHADLQCLKLYLTNPISIVLRILIAMEMIATVSESIYIYFVYEPSDRKSTRLNSSH